MAWGETWFLKGIIEKGFDFDNKINSLNINTSELKSNYGQMVKTSQGQPTNQPQGGIWLIQDSDGKIRTYKLKLSTGYSQSYDISSLSKNILFNNGKNLEQLMISSGYQVYLASGLSSDQEKVIQIPDFQNIEGSKILVHFDVPNQAQNPKLTIKNGDNIIVSAEIKTMNNENIEPEYLLSSMIYQFYYDGIYFRTIGGITTIASSTLPGNVISGGDITVNPTNGEVTVNRSERAVNDSNGRDITTTYALKNHSSENVSTYGAGTDTKFGHVKLSDEYKNSLGKANASLGASQYAVYMVYKEIATIIDSVEKNRMNYNLVTNSDFIIKDTLNKIACWDTKNCSIVYDATNKYCIVTPDEIENISPELSQKIYNMNYMNGSLFLSIQLKGKGIIKVSRIDGTQEYNYNSEDFILMKEEITDFGNEIIISPESETCIKYVQIEQDYYTQHHIEPIDLQQIKCAYYGKTYEEFSIKNSNYIINSNFEINRLGASSYENTDESKSIPTVDLWQLDGIGKVSIENGNVTYSGMNEKTKLLQYITNPAYLLVEDYLTLSFKANISYGSYKIGYKLFNESGNEIKRNDIAYESNLCDSDKITSLNIITDPQAVKMYVYIAFIPTNETYVEIDESTEEEVTKTREIQVTPCFMKLERGKYVTPYIPKSYAQEMNNCCMYNTKGNGSNGESINKKLSVSSSNSTSGGVGDNLLLNDDFKINQRDIEQLEIREKKDTDEKEYVKEIPSYGVDRWLIGNGVCEQKKVIDFEIYDLGLSYFSIENIKKWNSSYTFTIVSPNQYRFSDTQRMKYFDLFYNDDGELLRLECRATGTIYNYVNFSLLGTLDDVASSGSTSDPYKYSKISNRPIFITLGNEYHPADLSNASIWISRNWTSLNEETDYQKDISARGFMISNHETVNTVTIIKPKILTTVKKAHDITSGNIEIKSPIGKSGNWFRQFIEKPEQYIGKQMTFSTQIKDCTENATISIGVSDTNKSDPVTLVPNEINFTTWEIPEGCENLFVEFMFNDETKDEYIQIDWTKLELGGEMTEYHPKEYVENLIGCQSYYQYIDFKEIGTYPFNSTVSTNNNGFLKNIPFKSFMRIPNPTYLIEQLQYDSMANSLFVPSYTYKMYDINDKNMSIIIRCVGNAINGSTYKYADNGDGTGTKLTSVYSESSDFENKSNLNTNSQYLLPIFSRNASNGVVPREIHIGIELDAEIYYSEESEQEE